jgi:hypothetical protein
MRYTRTLRYNQLANDEKSNTKSYNLLEKSQKEQPTFFEGNFHQIKKYT